MHDTAVLSHAEADRVLTWLDVPPAACTREWLDALLAAYVQRVPWESASRIARRASLTADDDPVRWPAAFWQSAMAQGLGGTCFESNLAMSALLAALDIGATFTINDRPPTAACHSALVVSAGDERLVVDAGFPLHAAVPLPRRPGETRETHTRWGTYSAHAAPAAGRFLIGQRPHPVPLAFELIARPVPLPAYVAATRADYGPGGLFLDRVVIKKIVDGASWRFASGERPWTLEHFRQGRRQSVPLPTAIDATAAALSHHFGMDEDVLARALYHVGPETGSGVP